MFGSRYRQARKLFSVLKYAPLWVKDLAWEELDTFFVETFQEVNRRHRLRYNTIATTNSIYDYANRRWIDR